MTQIKRSYERATDQLRPVQITPNINAYAEGSVMVEFGRTKVLCTASIEENIPQWLKGKGQGWITAEYSMLPRATHTRSKRERDKVSGRTHEIQRLIGRALRSVLDLRRIGERTVMIDCDVIQADGGTRTAAITGGYVALALAMKKLKTDQKWFDSPITGQVAAVSVGMRNQQILLDLDYDEDCGCDVDMNFVMLDSGLFVEVQGTAENQPFSHEHMLGMTEHAVRGIRQLHELQKGVLQG